MLLVVWDRATLSPVSNGKYFDVEKSVFVLLTQNIVKPRPKLLSLKV